MNTNVNELLCKVVSTLVMGEEWLTIDTSFVAKFRVDVNLNAIHDHNKRSIQSKMCLKITL